MSAISDKIKATNDIDREPVVVPEWDVTIEVRSMSAKARAKLLKQAAGEDGNVDIEKLSIAVLVASCFDPETGEPVFSVDDSGWLEEKSSAAVERLAQAGMRLSGMSKDAVEEGKGDS